MKFAPVMISAAALCLSAEAAQTMQSLRFVGTRSISAGPTISTSQELGLEFRQGPEEETSFLKNVTGRVNPARVSSDHVPKPDGLPVAVVPAATGFPGLTHFDQRFAGNGNQFSSEP